MPVLAARATGRPVSPRGDPGPTEIPEPALGIRASDLTVLKDDGCVTHGGTARLETAGDHNPVRRPRRDFWERSTRAEEVDGNRRLRKYDHVGAPGAGLARE